jgi:hypothetical protein
VWAVVVAVLVAVAVIAFALPRDRGGSVPPTGPSRTGSASPSADGSSGPAGPIGPPVNLIWSKAYELARSGLLEAAMNDAVVVGRAVVAVGHAAPGGSAASLDDAAAWRSDDGRLWERVGQSSLAQDGDQRMISIIALGDRLVAAGWNGPDAAVWTSTDLGDTGERSGSGAFGGPGLQRIRDLVSTGSGLVAVGSDGLAHEEDAAVWTSNDGLRWHQVEDPSFVVPHDQEMWAVDAIGGRLVVVGFTVELGTTDGAVWTFDGDAWSRVNPATLTAPGIQVMLDVAGGGGDQPLVAVGCEDPGARCDTDTATASDAVVWTSRDGTSWERGAEGGRLAVAGNQVMRALVVYRGDFIAVGSNGGSQGDIDGGQWTSADGVTWRAVTQSSPAVTALGGPGDQSLRAVVVYGSRGVTLFAFGLSEDATSVAARVWSARAIG